MRDLIRNYKKIIAGGNRDSDSDESVPLVSSSCSSTSSFGSFFDRSRPTSESEDETKNLHNPLVEKAAPLSPLSLRKKLEREIIFGTKLEPPKLDIYCAPEFIFDKDDRFSKLTYDPMSIQTNSNVLTAPSSSDECSYQKYNMDYNDQKKPPTHNSIVTIFAIWNTTMGSSLLAMSWGIQMAGLFPGIAINILIAALCLYTCHLLLKVNEKHGMPGLDIEVSHLCSDLLGKWAEILAKIFSVVVLLGADIVYMILMSNFLYNSVYFVHDLFTSQASPVEDSATVLCPKEMLINSSMILNSSIPLAVHVGTLFDKVWDLYSTVPLFLSVILFGVLNFKSPTFFTKFNSLGTISVLYLIIFVAVKAYGWGINMPDWSAELYFKPTFSALSGMLSLSYFIHNIIISIMRNNKHQEHNGRDLFVAFGLITFTYLFIGIIFYVSFPLAKSCIEDNIFNNFSKKDTLTLIARVLLMFQLFTVFPLISFMLRKDIMGNINDLFKNYSFGDFTYGRVVARANLTPVLTVYAAFSPWMFRADSWATTVPTLNFGGSGSFLCWQDEKNMPLFLLTFFLSNPFFFLYK